MERSLFLSPVHGAPLSVPHHPWNHDVLLIAFVPASTTALLFKRPYEYQGFPTLRIGGAFGSSRTGGKTQGTQYGCQSLDASCMGGQVVDDGDGDGEVEGGVWVWEDEAIRDDGSVTDMVACDSDQIL